MKTQFRADQNKGMFSQIVGRCHVSGSNLQVIRYVISRLKKQYTTWKTFPKKERKKALKIIIQIHAENRGLYRAVMSGQFSKRKG